MTNSSKKLIFEIDLEYAIKKEKTEIDLPFYGKNDFFHDDQIYVRIAPDANGEIKETVVILNGSTTDYELSFQYFDKNETHFFKCHKSLKENDFNIILGDAIAQVVNSKK